MHSTSGPRLGTPPAAADGRPELDVAHGRLLELLPSAVLVIELDGRISFANAEAERLFGMTREQLSSVGIDDLVPEQLRRVLLSSSMDLSDKERVERETIEQLHSMFEQADHGICC